MELNYQIVSKKLLDTLVYVMDQIGSTHHCDHACKHCECHHCHCDCHKHHHHDHHEDGILLTFGEHTLTLKTGFEPKEVYVAVDSEGTPVCSGSLSTFSVSKLEDGFVLYANIAEEFALVKWIVKK